MSYITFTGTGAADADEDTIVQVDAAEKYNALKVMTTAGSVEVIASLESEGDNWSGPLSLQDLENPSSAPVLAASTTAGRMYGLRGRYRRVIIRQNGATAATVIAAMASDL